MRPKTLIYLLALALCYVIVMCLASCSPKSYSGITYDCNGDTVSCMGGRFKILDGSKACGKMVTFKPTVNRSKINSIKLKK